MTLHFNQRRQILVFQKKTQLDRYIRQNNGFLLPASYMAILMLPIASTVSLLLPCSHTFSLSLTQIYTTSLIHIHHMSEFSTPEPDSNWLVGRLAHFSCQSVPCRTHHCWDPLTLTNRPFSSSSKHFNFNWLHLALALLWMSWWCLF